MPVNFRAMSWLLAGFIPGLLMLSTVGLQRLESVMHTDRPSTGEAVTRLQPAPRTAPQKVVPLTGFSGLSPRMEPAYRLIPDEPGLPTRQYGAASSNPQYQSPRLANPV